MPPNPRNAETLFHQALEIGPHERAAFLTGACGSDATLRHRVEALLAAHEQAKGFLPEGTGERMASLQEETPLAETIGTMIGRYKLLEKLGEGGFGAVWAAEQREPIRRRVALKIIKPGMDTKQVIARFEAERQALAMMDHPNIAKVLDAGATETGRLYFVMELVRGIPITKYSDQERLGIRDRLDLFIKICHAIQHAHQKGIIHRDIKPSNIMVTLHDGVPVPKVIDFGIAKATQAELTEKTIYTQFQQFIGTPAYMSPEQAEMTGLDIDTRSDIYSLGVLLYELLTGRTPFDGKALLQAGLDEMRRIIREQEPERPSTRLTQEIVAADVRRLTSKSEVQNPKSEEDGASSRWLLQLKERFRQLRGDLDWIVMKCLEKDRTRRYETANGLATDLMRHLNNETIVARPPSAAYRLQKAWRRNKLVYSASIVVVAALVIGSGVSTWQAIRATQAKREAVEHGQSAEKSAKEARQAEQKAESARVAADEATAKVTRNLYFAEMNLAGNAAAEPGGISRVAEITARWRPEKEATDQRGWEWYYLRSLLYLDVFTLKGHTNGVMSVAWSPDGKRLASASSDNTIRVWDADGGTNVLILRGHTNGVRAVAWSQDGKRLASGSHDNKVKIWDLDREETMTLRGHANVVNSVMWSPDGKLLASGSWDQTIKVWDAVSGTNIRTLRASNEVNSVAWSPDGKRLASANGDSTHSTLTVWDAVSEQVIHTLYGHSPPSSVNSVAWSPDGKRLASVSNDHKVIVWDAANGTNIVALRGHTDKTLSVAWSPDGKRVASASSDITIRVWDADSGTNVRTLRGHTNSVETVAWSPDGKRLASGSRDNKVKVWDVDREETVILRGHTNVVNSVAWSPDGKHLASSSWDKTIKIWDAVDGMNTLTLRGHTDTAYSVAWSPDGKHLASASSDNTVRVWDAASGTNFFTRAGEDTRGLVSVAWSPNGRRLVWSGWYQTNFNILDVDTRTNILARGGHKEWVFSALWSPDGKLLASASFDGTVEIWDADNWRLIRALTNIHTDSVRSVAWSPDARRLASASFDGTVKVFESVGWTNIFTLSGHTGGAASVGWSPDGKRMASGSFDNTVKVWDADSGQETMTLRGHTSQVQSVAWSPDGKRIASASRDNTIRVWDARKAYALERDRSANAEAEAAGSHAVGSSVP